MRIPVSTYRLQFRGGFGFREARALAPYLHKMGITDVYTSPLLQSKPGSSSGYDVVDPVRLDPVLGSREDFEAFSDELQRLGMGLLLDIVPNHMAAHTANSWWRDVLENGPCSPYAAYFDIDWDPESRRRDEKLVWPILGAPFAEVLERQELKLALTENGIVVRYYDLELPLDPSIYPPALSAGLHADIPPRSTIDLAEIDLRYRRTKELKEQLWTRYRTDPVFAAQFDENIRIFNGTPGDPRSFDSLDNLLAQQPYSLSFWRVAREKINYRRFFDIVDLVAVKVQDPEVFNNSHMLIGQLVDQGRVTGLRIDHIDGLYDPYEYLCRLRERLPESYLVVEKILEREEPLCRDWPVAGSTGYDLLNVVGNVMVDPEGLVRLDVGQGSFADLVYQQKKRTIQELFAGELLSLGLQLGLLAVSDRYAKDASPQGLQIALVEVTACLDVYRTYTRSFEVRPADRVRIEDALREARRRNPAIGHAELGFVQRVLLLETHAGLPAGERVAWLRFVQRWQQFTGPVMAKGVEDTAFYIWSRLISMNEVGGSPSPVGIPEFHRFHETRAAEWPHALNPGSTHDTKRGEDARARIGVLSELPDAWLRTLGRWRRWNARSKSTLDGAAVPGPVEELFIYQTLLGAWPIDPARLEQALLKSLREAKVHTNWTNPNQAYEGAVLSFVNSILVPSESNRFLPDFVAFQNRIAAAAVFSGLSQTLLRLTAPGVPDIYQGSELWDFNLVDPDNRRPVDFTERARILDSLEGRDLPDLLTNWRDGAIKLFTIHKTLAFRRDHAALFQNGRYIPLETAGERADHAIAFARHDGAEWVVTLAPRWTAKLSRTGKPPMGRAVWRDTHLRFPENAPTRWRNILTGETIGISSARHAPVSKLLRQFPLALLSALPD